MKVVLSAFALIAVLLMTGVPAHADQIVDLSLSAGVTASMPLGYYEGINATFQWDVTTNSLVLGSMLVDGQGTLGALEYTGNVNPSIPYYSAVQEGPGFTFQTSAGDAFAVWPLPNLPFNTAFAFDPGVYTTQIFVTCASTTGTCNQDGFGGFWSFNGYLTVGDPVAVPEPSSMVLLLSEVGLIGAFAAGWRRYRVRG